MSMEDAPRDGTPILATDGQTITTVYFYARGSVETGGSWNLVECGAYAEDGEWTPIYWMELPPLPK